MRKTLSFCIGTTPDGRFAAYSTTEPVFCFFADTEDAATAVGHATLESYVHHFVTAPGAMPPAATGAARIERISPRRMVYETVPA